MSKFYGATLLRRKEGKHYKMDNLEFWAEEGVICCVDDRTGMYNAITCPDFAARALTLHIEAKRMDKWSDTRKNLFDCVMKMRDAWKEAKEQGDMTDLEVMKTRLKERKRAIMVTGMW